MASKSKIDISEYSKNFPKSKKHYTKGSSNHINVPSRVIEQSPTIIDGKKKQNNKPIYVYDTTGLYTDENYEVDILKGLRPIRENWILNRGDVVSSKRNKKIWHTKNKKNSQIDGKLKENSSNV